MTVSKRLALLGAQSVLSVAKTRALGSSFSLIGRRPVQYRQFSQLSKDSDLSKNSQEHLSRVVQDESERLRRDMEKMRFELKCEIEKSTNKIFTELQEARSEFLGHATNIVGAVSAVGFGVLCIVIALPF